jgi:glycosyltransferase involved in cell wall biosynthesis
LDAHVHAPFRIVQVNLQSDRGGDGRIVSDLHRRYRALGYSASLLVGRGTVTAGGGRLLPNDQYRSLWARAWLACVRRSPVQSVARSKSAKVLSWMAEPKRRLRIRNGFEDFEFPATLPLLSRSVGEGPTILHLHNLHGGYFDLRALPALSDLAPIVLTLHDQWAFTGHCAHSFECERWRLGCGHCPDLTIYPGIPKDRTAENFVVKQRIFSRTSLYLASPSKWLMDKAKQSLLAPAIEEERVIPNGVDTSVFHPGDRDIERSRLGLPRESRIVLSAGAVARSDHWTDRRLFRSTLRCLAEQDVVGLTLVLLGSERGSQQDVDGVQVIHRPYEHDTERVASYYRASDVYLHPARAETFSIAALESLACGVPVVATDVGGIPEVVRSLWAGKHAIASPPSAANGILVEAADTTGLARAIDLLLSQEDLRRRLGENGSSVAASEFSIVQQAQRYLNWYREILHLREPTARSVEGTAYRRRGRRR